MKMILSLVVVLVVVLFPRCNAEILFRGIPWQLPLEKYVSELEVQGLMVSTVDYRSVVYDMEIMDIDGYCVCFKSEDEKPVCNVAGYDVDEIVVYSVPRIYQDTIDENGLNSIVYSSSYTLIVPNGFRTAVKDLFNKLSLLYGDGNIVDTNLYYWKGENNTEAKLLALNVEDAGIIVITYMDKSIYPHMLEIEQLDLNIEGL